MIVPTSTYRVQFRNGVTFEHVARAVPYLRDLGVSHLYASPIFTATKGSTHGYDVTNCNEIDSDLGGRTGFDKLSQTLRHAGLGLILDIVPNHMAASVENSWWADVLKHGRSSIHADYFDIDWSEPLTLPILGKTFDQALADHELAVRRNAETGEYSLAYFETLLPLKPGSVELARTDLATGINISAVHEAQAWRLVHWTEASSHLSYRRFFEVTGLVGLRVEAGHVFDASHALILELVRSGQVQGLRLDHIDGLTDPTAYLRKLRDRVGPDVFVVVEKILAKGEELSLDWPVQGTTGYEFITALSHLFIDPDGMQLISRDYAELAPVASNYAQGLRNAKRQMVAKNFKGEKDRLVRLVGKARPDLAEDEIAAAITELLVAFPVYRTYGGRGVLGEQDKAIVQTVAAEAARHVVRRDALDWIVSVLENGSEHELRSRFQQLSGPIMAKALEDTLFYRFNRLLAANEVGGEPASSPGGTGVFHDLMINRQERQPEGLSATSTHDTKRGEDARARLYALSEAPTIWTEAVRRWRAMNSRHRTRLKGRLVPEPEIEWMLYQALVGAWVCNSSEEGKNITSRFVAYAEKAVREAKLTTSWNEQDPAYEDAVKDYAAALAMEENTDFRRDFLETLTPFVAAGAINSYSQTLIKLSAPGIPDIYQGSEASDFSLVDPDNRRVVDFDHLALLLAGKDEGSAFHDFEYRKQRIITTLLHLRQEHADLFQRGDYVPVAAVGPRSRNVIAFARVLGDLQLLIVVPRLMLGHIAADGAAVDEFWVGTVLEIPFVRTSLKNVSSGRTIPPGPLTLQDILGKEQYAILMASS